MVSKVTKLLCVFGLACFIVIILVIMKMYNLTDSSNIENFDNNSFPLITSNFNSNIDINTPDKVAKMKRPFVNIFDQKGRKLNIILISKPFSGDHHNKIYLENRKGNIFIGVCSYLEFPNMVSNPFEDFTENYKKYRYKEITEGWIHCFRDPENYFPKSMPTYFASESDWSDCNYVKPDPKITEKKYDFIYICLKVKDKSDKCDDWATFNKNWKLAQKCLKIMCNKFKLKGLLVGRKGCELPGGCSDLMETTDMLKYADLRYMYQKSKFIFIPNEKDASPRVLAEAFCMNIPTLINKNILGGWKYINDKTGEFFTDENDLEKHLSIILNKVNQNAYSPRDYFVKNYGPRRSGERLKEFLYKHWEDRINIPKSEVDYLTIEFQKKDYKNCQ